MSATYILVGDGTSTTDSWRADAAHDRHQHWCRRDAVARITYNAIYGGIGATACSNVTFLFHQGADSSSSSSSNENHLSVLSIDSEISSDVLTPSENALITVFKEAARAHDKEAPDRHPLLVSAIGGSGFIRGPMNDATKRMKIDSKCRYAIGSHARKSVFVSQHPYREISVLPSLLTGISSNSCTSSSSSSSPEGARSAEVVIDKRAILKLLQSRCDMDFLRAKGLNCSENAILKKFNKPSLETLYDEWKKGSGKDDLMNLKGSDGNSMIAVKDSSTNDLINDKLTQTFVVLFARVLLKANLSALPTKGVTVLLFHEDYPLELPVFDGHNPDYSNSCSSNSERIICVLGSVRDCSNIEIQSILRACRFLSLPVKGYNLGRVSEFTSKIITALNSHVAMNRIDSKTLSMAPDLSYDISKIGKLKSLRHAAPNGIGGSMTLHYAIWVPYLMTDVSIDIRLRGKLHQLLQCIVCSLWKSKVANDSLRGDGGDGLSSDMASNVSAKSSVTNIISVVFIDGSVLTLNQLEFLSKMANNSFSAPTEYQVLVSLIDLLESSDSDVVRRAPSNEVGTVAQLIFPVLKRKRKKCFRLIDVIDAISDTKTLSDYAYASKCACSGETSKSTNSSEKWTYLFLFRSGLGFGSSGDRYDLESSISAWADGINTTLHKTAAINRYAATISQQITCIQHFGYHGVLTGAIDRL